MTQQTETKSMMTEQETAEVAIFSETLTALQEERPVPNVFRWDILQVYAKLGDSCDRSGVPYMQEVEVEDEFLMKKGNKEK